MNRERIMLTAAYRLLGKRKKAFAVILLPRCVGALLWVLLFAALQKLQLLYSEPALGFLCLAALISGRILVWSLVLLRDRWFLRVAKGEYTSLSQLVAVFGFRDVVRAVTLNAATVSRCVLRCTLLFVPTLAFGAISLYLFYVGVSQTVAAVLLAGNCILVINSIFWCCAACAGCICSRRLRSCDSKTCSRTVREPKTTDRNGLKLFLFSLSVAGTGSARRKVALLIYSQQLEQNEAEDEMLIKCE